MMKLATFTVFFSLFVFAFTPQSRSATIAGIKKSKDRIILKLTRNELAVHVPGEDCLLKSATSGNVTNAKILTMDPVKSTALIVLEEPSEDFAKKEKITFLPVRWNFARSPVITMAPQFYQFDHDFTEFQLRTRTGELTQTTTTSYSEESVESSEEETKVSISGSAYKFDLASEFIANTLGLAIQIDLGDEKSAITTDDFTVDYESDVTIFRPLIWYAVEGNWRIGLGLEHTILKRSYAYSDTTSEYNSEADQGVLSVLYSELDYQFGFWTKNRAIRTIPSDVKDGSGQAIQDKTYFENYSSELEMFYRSLNAPDSVSGFKLGVIFWERARGDGDMAPQFDLYELVRLSYFRESRLSSGNKIESVFSYKGSKTSNLVGNIQGINTLGFNLIYRALWSEGITWGIDFNIDAGSDAYEEEEDVGNSEIRMTEDSISGFHGYLALLIAVDL